MDSEKFQIDNIINKEVHAEFNPKQIRSLIRYRRYRKNKRAPTAIKQDPYWGFVWPFYTPEDDCKLRTCLPVRQRIQPTYIGGDPELELYWRFVWPYYTPTIESQLYIHNINKNKNKNRRK